MQAQNHDPQGRFVRQWLPAYRKTPDTWVLGPWLMPQTLQRHNGVFIGHDIPKTLVELRLS